MLSGRQLVSAWQDIFEYLLGRHKTAVAKGHQARKLPRAGENQRRPCYPGVAPPGKWKSAFEFLVRC